MSEILVNTIKKADGTGSLTVPADTGTVLTSATALSNFPSGFANGITNNDYWRVTTSGSYPQGGANITNNWERFSGDGVGYLGTGMTQSSGVFTFPTTGIWLILFKVQINPTAQQDYAGGFIQTTLDGTNFGVATQGWNSTSDSNNYAHVALDFVFDVTNVSTHKVRFGVSGFTTVNIDGSTTDSRTAAHFIRLGDT